MPRVLCSVFLLAAGSAALVSQNIATPTADVIHSVEIQQRLMLARSNRQELAKQAVQQDHQRQFAEKFNQLVAAVRNFAEQYNQNQGSVWPQREADKLRSAMHQLQQLEKSLRDDSKAARSEPVKP